MGGPQRRPCGAWRLLPTPPCFPAPTPTPASWSELPLCLGAAVPGCKQGASLLGPCSPAFSGHPWPGVWDCCCGDLLTWRVGEGVPGPVSSLVICRGSGGGGGTLTSLTALGAWGPRFYGYLPFPGSHASSGWSALGAERQSGEIEVNVSIRPRWIFIDWREQCRRRGRRGGGPPAAAPHNGPCGAPLPHLPPTCSEGPGWEATFWVTCRKSEDAPGALQRPWPDTVVGGPASCRVWFQPCCCAHSLFLPTPPAC